MPLRYASKTDWNQVEIVSDLRRLGFDVDIVSREKGLYDLVVSGAPAWCRKVVAVRVEIKRDEKAKLTPAEETYWAKQKNCDNLIIATCTDDVLTWFGRAQKGTK